MATNDTDNINNIDDIKNIDNIYTEYFNDVYLYILSLSKNKEVSEDITSDTFYKAMKNIDKFRGDCSVKTWLCQIAKNCYFTYLKRNKKHEELAKLQQITEETQNKTVEIKIEDSEQAFKIHKILHDMQEPYKEIFTLRTFGELSFKQIANLFGKTENWACVSYHRAKDKIVKELNNK